jgi:hypothetical protein
MTGINSAVTGKLSDPPVIMTGITSRFISRPVEGKNLLLRKAKYTINRTEACNFTFLV